jgi:hypothetical protein
VADDLIARYAADGYAIVRGLYAPGFANEVLATLKTAVWRFSPSTAAALEAVNDWNAPELSATLIALREQEPRTFSAIYDAMQTSLPLVRATCRDELVDAALALLGEDRPGALAITGVVMRMDAPMDRRNVFDWHQEASYYPQNQLGENGTVVWLPLGDVTADMGAVMVCTGSHRGQKIAVEEVASGELHSRQLRIPDTVAQRYPIAQLPADDGDAIFMNMATIHRSGINSSRRMRFSALARFHRMRSDDFVPGQVGFTPNRTVQAEVLARYPRSPVSDET